MTKVQFPGRSGICLFAIMSRPGLDSTQLYIQWVPGTLYQEVKWLRLRIHEAIPPFLHTSLCNGA